jgi:hypothetical protein
MNISVAFTFNHSVVDALSVMPWFQELDLLLLQPGISLKHRTSFQLFAELLFTSQSSKMGIHAVNSNVRHLRGISKRLTRYGQNKRRLVGGHPIIEDQLSGTIDRYFR